MHEAVGPVHVRIETPDAVDDGQAANGPQINQLFETAARKKPSFAGIRQVTVDGHIESIWQPFRDG
jgi:hypothetical protein